MNLVFVDSLAEFQSVKKFLELSKIDNYITARSLPDLLLVTAKYSNTESETAEKLNLYIFDFKKSTDILDYLAKDDLSWCSTLSVYCTDISIGKQYRELTESVHVMPPTFNMMLLLWNHPAFQIDNLSDVSSVNEVIKLNVSPVNSDSTSIRISTEIHNNSLVALNINKVNDIELSELSLHSERRPSQIKRGGVARSNFKGLPTSSQVSVEPDVDEVETEISSNQVNTTTLFKGKKSTSSVKSSYANTLSANLADTKQHSGFRLANLKRNSEDKILTISDYLIVKLGITTDLVRQYDKEFKQDKAGCRDLAEYCYRKGIFFEEDYLSIMSELYSTPTLSKNILKQRTTTFEGWSFETMKEYGFIQLIPQKGEDDIVVVVEMYDPKSASKMVRMRRNSATIYYTPKENLYELLRGV